MTFLSMIYNLTTDVLTFWMPVFFTFKFLMDKDVRRIPTILKFWCMISCYNLISLLLSQILDDNIFPFVNIAFLLVLNYPPYEITEKIYNVSLGAIYLQNRKAFEQLQETIVKIFDKNSQKLKNKMKDSTGQKIKGAVGDILMATLTATSKKQQKKPERQSKNSDDDTDRD